MSVFHSSESCLSSDHFAILQDCLHYYTLSFIRHPESNTGVPFEIASDIEDVFVGFAKFNPESPVAQFQENKNC